MILSHQDITRIETLGFKKEDFCFLDEDGFFKLKNIDNECFFLKNNRCSIYEHRPQGCKFYPIIFDVDKKKPALDDECPLINTISDKVVLSFEKDLLKFVRMIEKER